MDNGGEEGFSLVELLVVVLILAILAVVAIPVFLSQREKAREAQAKSVLKNASLAVESWGSDQGNFSGLDYDTNAATYITKLQSQGFYLPGYITRLRIQANRTTYCIEIQHELLGGTTPTWKRATFQSEVGSPQSAPDTCPSL